jgi:hypothetical protein
MLPDLWLGKLQRPGPGCFCHGYARYLQFTRPLLIEDRIDAVVRASDPHPALRAVFGDRYARKGPWPD